MSRTRYPMYVPKVSSQRAETADEKAFQLGILLSQQESIYGFNMMEALTAEDLQQVQYMVREQGWPEIDAKLLIFEDRFNPKPQNNFQPTSQPKNPSQSRINAPQNIVSAQESADDKALRLAIELSLKEEENRNKYQHDNFNYLTTDQQAYQTKYFKKPVVSNLPLNRHNNSGSDLHNVDQNQPKLPLTKMNSEHIKMSDFLAEDSRNKNNASFAHMSAYEKEQLRNRINNINNAQKEVIYAPSQMIPPFNPQNNQNTRNTTNNHNNSNRTHNNNNNTYSNNSSTHDLYDTTLETPRSAVSFADEPHFAPNNSSIYGALPPQPPTPVSILKQGNNTSQTMNNSTHSNNNSNMYANTNNTNTTHNSYSNSNSNSNNTANNTHTNGYSNNNYPTTPSSVSSNYSAYSSAVSVASAKSQYAVLQQQQKEYMEHLAAAGKQNNNSSHNNSHNNNNTSNNINNNDINSRMRMNGGLNREVSEKSFTNRVPFLSAEPVFAQRKTDNYTQGNANQQYASDYVGQYNSPRSVSDHGENNSNNGNPLYHQQKENHLKHPQQPDVEYASQQMNNINISNGQPNGHINGNNTGHRFDHKQPQQIPPAVFAVPATTNYPVKRMAPIRTSSSNELK